MRHDVHHAFTPDELQGIDWGLEYQAPHHPVPVIVTAEELVDKETGVIIARVEAGYQFYWAHHHIHVAPKDWVPNRKQLREVFPESKST